MFAQAPGQHKVLLILLLMLLNPWQASDSLEVESLALVVEENRYCHRYMGTEITVLETLIWYKKLIITLCLQELFAQNTFLGHFGVFQADYWPN